MNDEIQKFVIDDTVYETKITDKFRKRKPYAPIDLNKITAFIPGTIREIYVKRGQSVRAGEPLLILEAMKMKNTIAAPFNATIKQVHVQTGARVPKGALIIDLQKL
ncbi:MAG: acetyl-CoA carboxylase biotin carboxyl carrier protein subunit [Chloroflexota bacterium]